MLRAVYLCGMVVYVGLVIVSGVLDDEVPLSVVFVSILLAPLWPILFGIASYKERNKRND